MVLAQGQTDRGMKRIECLGMEPYTYGKVTLQSSRGKVSIFNNGSGTIGQHLL